MKILIGTNNDNKLKQFYKAFELYGGNFELMAPKDFGINEDADETGETVGENAKIKARYYGKKTGLLTLADDLGLFVDALNGAPGVHSKRWHNGTDEERCQKLIESLKDVSNEKRTAHYHGVLSFYDPDFDFFWEFEKKVEGYISDEVQGIHGFGYDSIFKLKDLGKHYAELTTDENLQISHRGLGVKALIDYLEIYCAEPIKF